MNYNILKELGRGGMATVYLAQDKKFDAEVAIKFLNKEFIHNDHIRKRFLAEAKNMYKMSHPNIIKVTDLIDEGDTVAFVMEHIDGETLKEFLDRKGKLSDDEIRNIFSQMLEAVGYVHEQGLIHRDIKPSNFMIDKKGKVKLLDFGIAKNTDTSSAEYTQTGTGMQMGTPMYMSPEQITETKSVTAQSDIYSLGVVLWQLVTGEKPYDTATLSNFQLQTRIVNEKLIETGTSWDKIIQKATEKDPQNRFSSTADFFSETTTNSIQNESTVIYKPNVSNEQTVVHNTPTTSEQEILFEISIKDKNDEYKYGFVNRNNIQVIPAIYEEVDLFENEIKVKINSKYGLLDINGNWFVQPIYDEIYSFDEKNFAAVQINGKWGFINRQGNFMIQPLFDRIWNFDEKDFSSVKINGKWGFINRKGNFIVQPIFDELNGFDEKDFAAVQNNGKWGFINRQGNFIVQPIFDGLNGFNEKDFAFVKINEKWGFINRQGDFIIHPIFDEEPLFVNNDALVKNNEKWGIITKECKWVIDCKYDSISYSGFDKNGFCIFNLNGKYGVFNREENIIIQPIFDEITSLDLLGYFLVRNNDKYGFVNIKSEWVVQPIYDLAFGFNEIGLCIVVVKGKYGVIDSNGNFKIQPIFDDIKNFNENGFYEACLNTKYGFIDLNGNWIIQPIFDDIKGGFEGDSCIALLNSKYGIIDKKGNWITPPIYDNIYYTIEIDNNDYKNFEVSPIKYSYEVMINNLTGYIDSSGKSIIQPLYKKIERVLIQNRTFFKVVNNDEKYGYSDINGSIIIPIQYDLLDNESEYYFSWDDDEIIIDRDDFDLESYFSGFNSVFLNNEIPRSKIENFLSSLFGNSKNTYDFFINVDHWLLYDNTFWGSGSEGILICANETNIWVLLNKVGTSGSVKIALNEINDEGGWLKSVKLRNGRLELNILANGKEQINSLNLPQKLSLAFSNFFQNEIEPKQDYDDWEMEGEL